MYSDDHLKVCPNILAPTVLEMTKCPNDKITQRRNDHVEVSK